MNTYINALFIAIITSYCQKLNRVAQLFCIINICTFNLSDTLYSYICQIDTGIEGKRSKNSSLASGIKTFYISSWISFGITLFLCFLQHLSIVTAILSHLSQHVVGSTVYDTHNLGNLVCSKTVAHSLDNRNTTANTGLEHKVKTLFLCQTVNTLAIIVLKTVFLSGSKQFLVKLCYYVLISGYNLLASGHGSQHIILSRVNTAHYLNYDVNFWVVKDFIRICCQMKIIKIFTLLVNISYQSGLDTDLGTYLYLDILSIFLQNTYNTSTNGSAAQ